MKKKKKEIRKLMNFKVTKSEREKILENAREFMGGNISDWIRFASQKKPSLPKN